MKKIKLALLFFAVFVVSLIVFFPYRQFYTYLIDKNLKGQVNINYHIKTASLFGIEFDTLKIEGVDAGRCRINLTPVGFILHGRIASVLISRGSFKAHFDVYFKKGFFVVKGSFPTQMLTYYLNKGYAVFLKNLNGNNQLYAKMSVKRNIVNIDTLKVAGDFELQGSGYVTKAGFRFMGYIKIGKIKQKISL